MSSRVVVLLSGGVDSLVCAELAREAGTLAGCVFVDYGHPAQIAEGWKAFSYHGRHGVPLRVVHAFGLHLADMAGDSGSSSRVVPARNLMLIASAANHAAGMGADEVWIGATAGDDRDYPDCRASWIEAVDGVTRAACGVGVRAPLIAMVKAEVVREALRLGIHRSDSVSCYQPGSGGAACGACASCVQADAAWHS